MRNAVLAVLGLDAALITAAVIGSPSFLDEHASLVYLAEPVILLIVYAIVVLTATRSVPPNRRRVLRAASVVGTVLGALEIANISVETFGGLSGAANLSATAPLILGPFLVWSVTAGWAARATGSLPMGLLAAVCTAMITMLIGVTYGLGLALATPSRLARNLADDPDYLRSGWTDVKAFVLANSFDNGFTHLLGGLIVGCVVGLVGGLAGIGLARARRPSPTRQADLAHRATEAPPDTAAAS